MSCVGFFFFYELYRINTSIECDEQIHKWITIDVIDQTGLRKGLKLFTILFDSFGQETHAVSHNTTEYFIKQKIKRALEEVDIYL